MIDLDALEKATTVIPGEPDWEGDWSVQVPKDELAALVRAVRCADAVYQSDGRSLPEMRALGAALTSFRNE